MLVNLSQKTTNFNKIWQNFAFINFLQKKALNTIQIVFKAFTCPEPESNQ